jgi:hypothetical protein
MRWREEVQLLREEMRRVIAFLEWQASWWVTLGGKHNGNSLAHTEGLRAYGHRQASIRKAIQTMFEHQWRQVDNYIKRGEGMSDPEAAMEDAYDSDGVA